MQYLTTSHSTVNYVPV